MTTLIIITATGFVVLIATLVWAAHRLTQPAPQQSAADPGMESALLDALPDAVVFVNDSGVILRANRAAANMFAMPALEGTRVAVVRCPPWRPPVSGGDRFEAVAGASAGGCRDPRHDGAACR